VLGGVGVKPHDICVCNLDPVSPIDKNNMAVVHIIMTPNGVKNFYKWELPNDSSFIFIEDYIFM